MYISIYQSDIQGSLVFTIFQLATSSVIIRNYSYPLRTCDLIDRSQFTNFVYTLYIPHLKRPVVSDFVPKRLLRRGDCTLGNLFRFQQIFYFFKSKWGRIKRNLIIRFTRCIQKTMSAINVASAICKSTVFIIATKTSDTDTTYCAEWVTKTFTEQSTMSKECPDDDCFRSSTDKTEMISSNFRFIEPPLQ